MGCLKEVCQGGFDDPHRRSTLSTTDPPHRAAADEAQASITGAANFTIYLIEQNNPSLSISLGPLSISPTVILTHKYIINCSVSLLGFIKYSHLQKFTLGSPMSSRSIFLFLQVREIGGGERESVIAHRVDHEYD
ncbi:hypothetical protein SO802_026345 [Lithocarpus litseifolius]|uniref:Uncharacterized protein n=1 Tax=Lithocarpus litseifolius TaxID=425828 RepID=A0AAW2C2R3_9ROSI